MSDKVIIIILLHKADYSSSQARIGIKVGIGWRALTQIGFPLSYILKYRFIIH